MKLSIPICIVIGSLCCSLPAADNTVILQQGVAPAADYAGCRTATLWPKPPAQAPAAGDKTLYLRGEQNRMLLKFAIPANLKGKKLARARLWVFLPSASKENRYCEIMCTGVAAEWDGSATWTNATASTKWESAGGDFDNRTPYHNGRPAGVTDSVELYAKNHNNWYNLMDWLPVSVPAGGMWVSFNVTPLAEKWLADPAANHGVMLMPVRIEDKRMPNPWEIDIPSETHADARLRPKLELELAPPDEPVSVGMTHAMRKVDPWSYRYKYRGEYKREYLLEMAANEYEGFQVVVYPSMSDLKGVKFTWSDLVDRKTGRKLPAGRMTCYCQDTVQMVTSWLVRDKYFGGKLYWVPDALVPAELSPAGWKTVRRQQAKPFWFTVHAPAGTPAGNYQTTIAMAAEGCEPIQLKLTVRVWDYEIPKKWSFCVVGSFGTGGIPKFYGKDYKAEWMDRWYDFLLDHRVAPVGQYSAALTPPVERIPHCIARGMNVIYLHGSFKRDSNLETIRQRHEQLKAMGVIDKAVLYVEDEGHRHEMRKHLSLNVRKVAPEAMMMVGGGAPNPEGIGYVDVWDPEIDVWPGTKLTAAEARKVVQECQGRGEKFFWYVAAGPTAPYPNVQLEYPLIGARSYIWMSWKYRATGFEYYCYNIWNYNFKGEKRWPEVPWDARAFVSRNSAYNCDGMLFYPGPKGTPCPSIRLENIRDGIEDWESFHMLRDYADALAASESGGATGDCVLTRALDMLNVPDEVVKSVTVWSQDPELLLKTRRELAELIVAIKQIVPKTEYERVRDARQAAQLKREREMLKKRAASPTTQPAEESSESD